MRRHFTAIAALLIASILFANSIDAALQGTASLKKPDAAAALSATEEILKTVSRLRALDIKHSVKSGFKTKDEIEQSVIHDLDEKTPAGEFEATQKTLVKLGLISREFRLRDYVVQLLREQVAGYYEPKTREFYLAAWLPLADQKRVIAHELVHALQDQHFDLKRFDDWRKGDSDAELAAHALVEGEATLVMIEYDFDQQGLQLDVAKLGALAEGLLEQDNDSDAKNYPVLAGAPRVLKENLQFPYLYGAGFVAAVLKGHSWQTLDDSYASLPASTEQIMHPDKFLARDNPVKIELPDLVAMLGKDWKQEDADVNGEFGYQVVLAEFISKRKAGTAAAGWGGDRYALFENKSTCATVLVQYTVWDSASDAKEFFDAYCERTEKRYKVNNPMDASGKARVYETSEGLVSIELRDKDVVIVEGAKDGEQLARLSGRLWQSKKR
ncbi:MAG TPA: hypothetical protein VK747_18980 [Blastocatellia bacterium]|nr:hypothetical protein [Blastocatellia bacterium]